MNPGQVSDPGLLCFRLRSDACYCSHEFFVEPGATSRGRLPVVQHQVPISPEVPFLYVNRTLKLLRAKSNLAHAHF